MQTMEVRGKKVKVVVQQGTPRAREVLMAVPGSVTFVTSPAGLEVIFADRRNVWNSSNPIRSFSSKDHTTTRCSLSSFPLSMVSVQVLHVPLAATPGFLMTVLNGGRARDGT